MSMGTKPQLSVLVFLIGSQVKVNADELATAVMPNNSTYTFLVKTNGFYAIDVQGIVMWCGETQGTITDGPSSTKLIDTIGCWKIASLPTVASGQQCKRAGYLEGEGEGGVGVRVGVG
jgi:hypothetical protein